MLRNFTVLYVDDDADVRKLIKLMFESEVKELLFATDGLEGYELYKTRQPDILISDINMPHLSGLELIKKIRREDKEQQIILVSAHDDKDSLLTAINAGANGFVPKPINFDNLYSTLQKIAKELHEKREAQYSKEKELEILYKLAHYDDLTKIPNRYLFDILLNQAYSRVKREEKKLALFFIDLDNFKYINDTFGHSAGDKVLQTFSQKVQKIIRKEDIFARRSGDEFLLLLEGDLSKEELENFAQKILETMYEPFVFEDEEVVVSMSIGICVFPDQAKDLEELTHLADLAMYKAKESGKNNFCFF